MTTPAAGGLEPTPTPPSATLVGQVISGRYRIQQLLGEGGMGAVYLAEHTHMRKRVALKLLHAEMSGDEEVLARFRREAEAAAHVEHPNVAAATDFGQTEDGAFFLVLEYVEGTSLRDALGQNRLDVARSLHVARQIAYALERAHAAGIVHRDLKPENVMLVHKGEDPDFVKVLDFGIAKVEPHPTRDATQPLTRLGTILGTPEYMAPEQALGETVGPGADLYAVGVMLYEMLTGKHPFDADDRMAVLSMHIVAPVPRMTDRNPAIDIPAPVEEVTRKLLEKDVKLRYPTARALVDAIDVAAAQSGVALPHAVSVRSFGNRESSPDLSRSPSPPVPASSDASGMNAHDDVGPQSSRIPVSRQEPWQDNDALAKTDYGLPASVPSLEAAKKTSPVASAIAFVEKQARDRPKVVLGIAAGVPVLVLIVLVIVLATRNRPPVGAGVDGGEGVEGEGPIARATTASPDKLRSAKAQGIGGLEALALDYPEDPAVHRELALQLMAANRTLDMFREIRVITRIDKSGNAVDDALVQAVVQAAQVINTADEAFLLLEGPLGAKGVDALIEMSNATKTMPPATRARAAKSLARQEVRSNASPAAAVYLEMKAAKKCEDKHELLDRAKENGDARIMPLLKSFKSPRGCGFMGMRDCYSCMRKDDALDDATKAVEARAGK